MKSVERGEPRRDIEGIYLRTSRKPYLVALDMSAQIAGKSLRCGPAAIPLPQLPAE